MKKIILFFVLFGLASVGFSQNFGFGIKAGLSSSKLDFKSTQFVPTDAQTGYHLGVFARVGGAGLYVQPELLFTQTSGQFELNLQGNSGSEKYQADFNRIDLPVMVGFKFLKFLRVQAGPIASFNIDSNLENSVGTVMDVDFKQATFGYQAGLGFDIGNLYIDAKYEGGLSNLTENISNFSTDNRLNQWVLSVGFKVF
ncbi:MAG: PorT family protein [Algoriphagus sp.]|uniref:porin family protein n=1 Tax=Algoriphagus sp. TaxID=1872435 RepID=UPI0018484DB2|nr:porin family protein [Algoriphagus sp.]NVJ84856.1 PorT family protein [Algoriphagus sp.]